MVERGTQFIRQPETAADVLAIIEDFTERRTAHTERDPEVRALWAVLTALRGPDRDLHAVKSATTQRIRALTLPKTARVAGAFVTGGWPDVSAVGDVHWHFRQHVASAIHALEHMGITRESFNVI